VFIVSLNLACEEKVDHLESGRSKEKTVAFEKEKSVQHHRKEYQENEVKPQPAQEVTNTIQSNYNGTFSASVATEATTAGMANIDYTFSITNEFVRLTTNSYHEPVRCNEIYKAVKKNRVIELFYTGKEEFCDTKNPMFFLKEEAGNVYAKGLGEEGTYHDWIKLKRR
jgi:polyribonucleotide nucleotidyltransferase